MTDADLIAGLERHAAGVIRQHFLVRRNCIPAARVCIEVLTHYGHRALPLPVSCLVLSPDFAAHVRGGGRWPATPEEWEAAGPRMYASALGGVPKGVHNLRPWGRQVEDGTLWSGHLAVWVPCAKRGLVIDVAVAQASRPEAGVVLPEAFVFDAPRAFRKGGLARATVAEGGAVVQYEAVPSNEGFRRTDFWTSYGQEVRRAKRDLIDLLEGRVPLGRPADFNRTVGAVITGGRV
jgi:hypothetical protein